MMFTEEEMNLINEAQETFEFWSHAMAMQEVKVNEGGYDEYEHDSIYGDTALLEVHYGNEVLVELKSPKDNPRAILSFSKRWEEVGKPLDLDELTMVFEGWELPQ